MGALVLLSHERSFFVWKKIMKFQTEHVLLKEEIG